jgi:ABC-type dipeptide/oligopeptide/nickel transport system permease component
VRRLSKHAVKLVMTLLVGGFVAATLVRLAPGFGLDEEQLDIRLNSQSIESLSHKPESDENLALFYIHYAERLLRGDLGMSRTLHRPVAQLLSERLPETLKSVTLGLASSWFFGISLAILSVIVRSYTVDGLFSLVCGVLLCIPAAVWALLFVLAHAPERLVLALIVLPKIYSYSRNLLVRSAGEPHVLTAHAKGLTPIRVLAWHILPTAAPQLLALLGVSVSVAFAAAVPVEALCDLPGIGQLAWKAALGRDLYLLTTLSVLVTAITLLANTFCDLLGTTLRGSES